MEAELKSYMGTEGEGASNQQCMIETVTQMKKQPERWKLKPRPHPLRAHFRAGVMSVFWCKRLQLAVGLQEIFNHSQGKTKANKRSQ